MADDDDDHGFSMRPSLDVINKELGLSTRIASEFVRHVNDGVYVHLDYYRSRGVYAMMACRSGSSATPRPSSLSKVMHDTCQDIRQLRDNAFRSTVIAQTDKSVKFTRGVMPQHKRLRAIALAQDDIVHIVMPAVGDMVEVGCDVLWPQDRKNGNSQLWVCMSGEVINYIANAVNHKHVEYLANPHEPASDVDNELGGDSQDVEPQPHSSSASSQIERHREPSKPLVAGQSFLRDFFRSA